MQRLSFLLTAILLLLLPVMSSCDSLDDTRVPSAPVHLVFNSVADWHTWGPGGATDHKRFIITDTERIPSGYPFTALDRTGFGGILIAEDVNGNVMVYDLCCPVECKPSVRVSIDTESLTAECPQCHSTYDIFSLYGHPLSGMAAEKGWGLRRYHASRGTTPFMVISN